MNCPVCNVELKIYVRQNIEVDYCPQCRGVWLDRGELDKIIEASLAETPPAANVAAPPVQPPAQAPAPAQPQAPYSPQQAPYQPPAYQQPHYKKYDDDDDDYHRGYQGHHGHHHKRKKRGLLGEIFDFD